MSFADYGPDMIAENAEIEAAARRIRPGLQHQQELAVSCTTCGAPVGRHCTDPGFVALTELASDGMSVHTTRADAAADRLADLRAERARDYGDDDRF